MNHYSVLLTFSVALVGCGPPQSIGSVHTSVGNVNGVETCILEVDQMSMADTIDALNQLSSKTIAIDPRIDSERTVDKLSVQGSDWSEVIKNLDEQWADYQILETDSGLTLTPISGEPSREPENAS